MNRIAELRKEMGLNQVGLALRLNISQYMVSAYETGRHQPTADMLILMADFFWCFDGLFAWQEQYTLYCRFND